jgi:excisionase family DNA binding protein
MAMSPRVKTMPRRNARTAAKTSKSLPSLDDFTFEKKPLYSPADVARILDVSDQTVLDWIHSERLFAAQVGPRLFRIPHASFMQFLGVPPEIRWTRGRKARKFDDAEFERTEPSRAKPGRG